MEGASRVDHRRRRPGHEHGPAVVRCTVFDARDRRSYERELLHARQEAERERERVQRLATVLQRSLLPPQLPTIAGVETAAYYHPASLGRGRRRLLRPLPGVREHVGLLPRRRLRQRRHGRRADLADPLHPAHRSRS
jgi:hypothetical protein